MVTTLERPRTPSPPELLIDRLAVRFLLDHRLGRLLTEDVETGEPLASQVHYVPDGSGGFVTTLPAGSEQVAAIRQGGTTLLSVRPKHGYGPEALRDVDGGRVWIWHVQAEVEAEVIADVEGVADALRRQIASVLEPLPQGDKSDPVARATRSMLAGLVAVRLRPTRVKARTRGPE